ARREELRERDRALAVHRGEDRADLLLLHAAEHRAHGVVVESVEDRPRLLRLHALVDLRHLDAARAARAGPAGGRAQRFELRRLAADELLERLQGRLARADRLLAAVEVLAAPPRGLEQLAEAAALVVQLGRDPGIGGRRLGRGERGEERAAPPPEPEHEQLEAETGEHHRANEAHRRLPPFRLPSPREVVEGDGRRALLRRLRPLARARAQHLELPLLAPPRDEDVPQPHELVREPRGLRDEPLLAPPLADVPGAEAGEVRARHADGRDDRLGAAVLDLPRARADDGVADARQGRPRRGHLLLRALAELGPQAEDARQPKAVRHGLTPRAPRAPRPPPRASPARRAAGGGRPRSPAASRSPRRSRRSRPPCTRRC